MNQATNSEESHFSIMRGMAAALGGHAPSCAALHAKAGDRPPYRKNGLYCFSSPIVVTGP
jgi:hypothetical protein